MNTKRHQSRQFPLRPSAVRARPVAHVLVGVLSLSLSLAVSGCEEEQVVEQPVARPVKMLAIQTGASKGLREYPGKIEAIQHAEMGFEVEGRVIEFRFKEGDVIRKGDLLARLDPRDYQATLDAAIARRNAARAEYERIQSLYEVEAVSRRDLDVARRNFEVAVANVKTARKAVQDTYLKAPFSGRFAKRQVEAFENVRAKQPVLTLQDNSTLKMILNVPERDVATAYRDLSIEERNKRVKVAVSLSSLPGRVFPAKIREFATTADPTTRTFQVTLVFKNPEKVNILPGMTARATVEGQQGTSPAMIPANAVLADEKGASFVWLVDPSSMTVRKKPVGVGEISGSEILVTEGLGEGDEIAVSGVRNLREGMQVRRLENIRR